jgi:hypothetical protein
LPKGLWRLLKEADAVPSTLKGKSENKLPAFWRYNRKSWVTPAIFVDWFKTFIHELEWHLVENMQASRYDLSLTMHLATLEQPYSPILTQM